MTKQLQAPAATEAELFKDNFSSQASPDRFLESKHCSLSRTLFDGVDQEPVLSILDMQAAGSEDDTVGDAVDRVMGVLCRIADNASEPVVSTYNRNVELLPALTIVEKQPQRRAIAMDRNVSAPNIIDVSNRTFGSTRSLWVVK